MHINDLFRRYCELYNAHGFNRDAESRRIIREALDALNDAAALIRNRRAVLVGD